MNFLLPFLTIVPLICLLLITHNLAKEKRHWTIPTAKWGIVLCLIAENARILSPWLPLWNDHPEAFVSLNWILGTTRAALFSASLIVLTVGVVSYRRTPQT